MDIIFDSSCNLHDYANMIKHRNNIFEKELNKIMQREIASMHPLGRESSIVQCYCQITSHIVYGR